MTLYTHITPNVIEYYGESENDLVRMPTTTKLGEAPYECVLAPEGSRAKILTDDGLRNFMLRSTGWVEIIKSSGGGGAGTDNFNNLSNKPQINDITLKGNKSFADLGLKPYDKNDIQALWDSVVV
jgi:hypothetical protein